MHYAIYVAISSTFSLAGLLLVYFGQYYSSSNRHSALRLSVPRNPALDPAVVNATGKRVTILMWTKVFSAEAFTLDPSCPFALSRQCSFSYNHTKWGEADAFVFHAPDFFDMHPHTLPEDFMGNKSEGRRMLPRVFMSQESASNLDRYYRLSEFPSKCGVDKVI